MLPLNDSSESRLIRTWVNNGEFISITHRLSAAKSVHTGVTQQSVKFSRTKIAVTIRVNASPCTIGGRARAGNTLMRNER